MSNLRPTNFTLRPSPSAVLPASGTLRVGAAEVPLRIPLGCSMAGYSRVGKDGTSARGALYARALVVENPDGARVAFVVLDLWAPSRVLQHGIAARTAALGIGSDRLMLVGTHVHTGPGHYFGDALYDVFAQREAGFDPELALTIVQDVAEAITLAVGRLLPGALAVGAGELWDVACNRSLPAFQATPESTVWHTTGPGRNAPPLDPESRAVDPRVTVLVASSPDGHPRAVFATFGCHATSLGGSGTTLDADWPGRAAARVRTRLGAPDLIVAVGAAAAGDQSPLRPDDLGHADGLGLARARAVGLLVGEKVADLVPALLGQVSTAPYVWRSGEWTPAAPAGAVASLPAWAYGKPTLAGSEESRTALFVVGGLPYREGHPKPEPRPPQGAKRAAGPIDQLLLGAKLTDLRPPERLPVTSLEIAGHRFLGLPGEPTVAFAWRLAQQLGGTPTTVLHCAGGYAGYFTTPEEYDTQHYEGASTLFGRRTFDHLSATVTQVLAGAAPSMEVVRVETWLRKGAAEQPDGWLEPGAALQKPEGAAEWVLPLTMGASWGGGRLFVTWAVPTWGGGARIPIVGVFDAFGARLGTATNIRRTGADGGISLDVWSAEAALPVDAGPAWVVITPANGWGATKVRVGGGGPYGLSAPHADWNAILEADDPSTRVQAPLGQDAADIAAVLLGVVPQADGADEANDEASLLGILLNPKQEQARWDAALAAGFTFPGMRLNAEAGHLAIPIDPLSVAVQTAPLLPWAPSAPPAVWLFLGREMPGFRSPVDAPSDFRYNLPPLRPDGSRRIALCGDFGSGLYHSRYIAVQMEAADPDVVIHVGDVYYAGRDKEVEDGLATPLGKDTAIVSERRVFLLPGNHELYSKGGPDNTWGGAWLDFIDKNRSAGRQEQEGSSFALHGDGLTVVGVDTDWLRTGRLAKDEMRGWVRKHLAEGRNAGRVTMLLTQNCGWDLDSSTPTDLFSKDLANTIHEGLVDFWFWGNVHYGALYDSTALRPVVTSCIGHGGYSEKRVKEKNPWPVDMPVRWVETAPRFPPWTDVRQDRMNNGFCLFELRADGEVVLTYTDWMRNLRAEAHCRRTGGRYRVEALNAFPMPAGPG